MLANGNVAPAIKQPSSIDPVTIKVWWALFSRIFIAAKVFCAICRHQFTNAMGKRNRRGCRLGLRFQNEEHYGRHAFQKPFPASINTVHVTTALPLAMASGVANSSGQWLSPSLHGINIIAAGAIRDICAMSWPAPLEMLVWLNPIASAERAICVLKEPSIEATLEYDVGSILIEHDSLWLISLQAAFRLPRNLSRDFSLEARRSRIMLTWPGITAAPLG